MHLDRLAGALLALAWLFPAAAAAADSTRPGWPGRCWRWPCWLARREPPRPTWSTFGETKTIEILTQDEGGDARETKVWIVVVEWQRLRPHQRFALGATVGETPFGVGPNGFVGIELRGVGRKEFEMQPREPAADFRIRSPL